MPRVSVIMGTYNHEDKLDQAIQSVADQTYKDWEFIICDDGSSDGTYTKLLAWSRRDRRIRVFRHAANRRLAYTLNHCLRYARGTYIARMDDDDVSYAERLERQVSFLDGHPEFDFVSSIVDCYDGNEIVKNRFYRTARPKKRDFLVNTQFVHPAAMFRIECLKRVGGYRAVRETERVEDYDLFMRLYAAGYKGYNIQEPLLRYLVNLDEMQRKRRYRYRINEAIVRFRGFRKLGLMPEGLLYAVRPLVIGLIPQKILWNCFYRKRG